MSRYQRDHLVVGLRIVLRQLVEHRADRAPDRRPAASTCAAPRSFSRQVDHLRLRGLDDRPRFVEELRRGLLDPEVVLDRPVVFLFAHREAIGRVCGLHLRGCRLIRRTWSRETSGIAGRRPSLRCMRRGVRSGCARGRARPCARWQAPAASQQSIWRLPRSYSDRRATASADPGCGCPSVRFRAAPAPWPGTGGWHAPG